MAGQGANSGGSGQRNRSHRPRPWIFPASSVACSDLVRGSSRPRPWPVPRPSVARTAPGIRRPRTHSGRRRRPKSRLDARPCWSAGVTRAERSGCKTVGSAYVGSNPTPATPCENGPLAGNSRLCGPFFRCPVMCHRVALGGAVSRCPPTYSGRDPCPRTVGAHRRLFLRTATDGAVPAACSGSTCAVRSGLRVLRRPR